MPVYFRLLPIALIAATLTGGCGGSDRHLPSSNPPEYDPKKASTTPAAPPRASSPPATPIHPTELEQLQSQLDSLQVSQKQHGEGKNVPFDPKSLQLLQGVTNPCETLSRLVPGLGSAQLFAGDKGAALKKALGQEADGIARRMDEHMAEGLTHSLGPGAVDCPRSVRPHQKSNFPQSARPVRTHVSSARPLLLAQTMPDASQDDYEVQKTSSRDNAPPDWVGWKKTDTMMRIGKEDRPAKGIREDYELVIGPKAKQCPHLEGDELKGMVDGTFDWSFMMFRAAPGPQSVLYRQTVKAELNGEVDDDARLQAVKFAATITLQHIGTALPAYSRSFTIQGAFTIDERTMGIPQTLEIITISGFSEAEAQARDAQLIGALTALMAHFSGPEYYNAQTMWRNPNFCVEMTFMPATKTKQFVPNESTPVKTELRTKKDHTLVPAKFKEAKERPREGNGRVSPRETESQRRTPATFTYQAPTTRVSHSGFRVRAVSRAGVAETKDGEWELLPSSYVLEFTSHIVQEPLNIVNPQFGMHVSANGFDAHVQATVPLRRREDDGQWVGEGAMQFETRTTTQPAPCEIRVQGTGTTTFHVKGGSISTGPEPFAVHLTILPGQSGEVAETHCTSAKTPEKLKELFATQGVHGGETHAVAKGGGWSAAFNVTRFTRFNRAKGGYVGDWTQVLNSDVVATKTMRVNCSIGMSTCQEETTLILRLANEPDAAASLPK